MENDEEREAVMLDLLNLEEQIIRGKGVGCHYLKANFSKYNFKKITQKKLSSTLLTL